MNEDNNHPAGLRQLFRNWLDRFIARKWFDIGLRAKMSALVTVGLSGLIGIFAFLAISTVRQATQQLLDEHVLHARILAETLDSNLGAVTGLLTILSSQIDPSDPQTNLQEWRTVFSEDFRSIQGVYLFDAGRNLIASTNAAPAIDWEQVPALQEFTDGSSRRISIEGLPRPYALIVVPILDRQNADPQGALAAILDLSKPDFFLSSGALGLDRNGAIQVIDGSGYVLTSTHPERVLTPATIDKVLSNLFMEGQPRVEACLGCAEDELKETGVVLAFAPLSNVPWGVIIWHDSQDLFAPVRRLGMQVIVLGFLAVLGAFGLVLVTTQSVIAPVQALTNATRKISETQMDASTLKDVECTLAASLAQQAGHRRDEIGILSNSFVAMCRRLYSSMKEIQSWNQELDERVQARTQQLSILNAVALTVNQSLDLDDILNRALDEVLHLAGIDMVAIFLQDLSKGQLKLSAYRGLSESAARLAYQVGLLDSSCGGVIELGRAIVVPDLSPYRGRGAQSLKNERISALMHIPLMTKGWALGSMCVGTRHNMQFDEDEQKLMTAIGNQIAIAVENARLYAEVQRKERLRGELFKKALAAQEDERKRIARELHDEISQSLTALLYEAEDGLDMTSHPTNRERLQSIYDLAQQSLNNIHKLIFDLRPSMLDQLGLIPALRWLAKTRLAPRGTNVTVEAGSGDESMTGQMDAHRLSPEVEITLYRVVQEAINNIARHAAAHNVEIRLDLADNVATVSVRDDGIGFDLTELSAAIKDFERKDALPPDTARGLGIIGMQERVELLGGELDIVAAPGHGTQIHIRVPLQERSLVYDPGPGG